MTCKKLIQNGSKKRLHHLFKGKNMRGCYIRTSDTDRSSGCRGGVGADHDCGGSAEYALEIGNSCNADLTMMALCNHVDEVLEFLNKAESPLAHLVLRSIKQTEKELENQLTESRKESK